MKEEREITHKDIVGIIDDLTGMVANGFSDMDKRFTHLENELKIEIEELKHEVRNTNRHTDQIVMPTLDSHARRIKDLELKLA